MDKGFSLSCPQGVQHCLCTYHILTSVIESLNRLEHQFSLHLYICNIIFLIIVKKVRKSVIVMQRRFCVYVCARITRQRVRERESLNQSYVYCLLHTMNSYKELV